MHPGTLSAGIQNGGYRPWPSESFGPFWHRIVRNLACPCDNSSQIWARITKFAPNMHAVTLSAVIENEGHWPWPSRSVWPFLLEILLNLACPYDNSSQMWARITNFAPNMHLGILLGSIENGGHSLTLTFKVIWPFQLKKRHSTSLLYTDLAWPGVVTRPKRAVV